MFRTRPFTAAGWLVLALSAVVEPEQALFTVGTCRRRGMLPNLLAASLAVGVRRAYGVSLAARR